MILMDLTEQADRDFGRARRRSWLRRLLSRLRGEPASRRIPPSFDEARRSLRALNRIPRGRRAVDPRQIVGSVGRRSDFDRSFMPLRASAGQRWKRVDLAFHKGKDLPPVRLYKLGDAYFVADLRARGVVFEEIDALRITGFEVVDGIIEVEDNYPSKGTGERGVWFRDSEGNLLASGQSIDR